MATAAKPDIRSHTDDGHHWLRHPKHSIDRQHSPHDERRRSQVDLRGDNESAEKYEDHAQHHWTTRLCTNLMIASGAAVLVDMLGERFAGYCDIFAGFLGLTEKDIISVLRAYPDILIQDGYSFRILPRGLLVCRRECHSFWTHGGPPASLIGVN
jgi:hypothetical protein